LKILKQDTNKIVKFEGIISLSIDVKPSIRPTVSLKVGEIISPTLCKLKGKINIFPSSFFVAFFFFFYLKKRKIP